MIGGLLEVGRITKAHGIKGDVVVQLWSEFVDRLSPGSELQTEQGPLVVLASQPYQANHLVHFEGISSRSEAELLRGLSLSATPREETGTLFVHELIGCRVLLPDGSDVGVVDAVESNPASDLLVLGDGQLVPLTFVTEHIPHERVVIDPPAGLLG